MTKASKEDKYYNTMFAETLRKLLENKEFNQNKLAEKLKVTRQTISLYANGKSLPDIETLKKIINYFKDNGYDYSCDYWLGLIDEPTTNIEEKEICRKYGLSKKALETLKYFNENKKMTFIKTINLLLSQKTLRVLTIIDRYINIKVKDNRLLAIKENGKVELFETFKANTTNYSIEECIEGATIHLLPIELYKLKKEGEINECKGTRKK